MYEINLIDKTNSISIIDNSLDISVNEVSSVVNISGENVNNILLSESINQITFTQTGVKGEKGDTGNDNLFIQDTQPVTTLDKYVWFETLGVNLKTLWVETGI